jgi:adenylylsulfate kinase-like enzyme
MPKLDIAALKTEHDRLVKHGYLLDGKVAGLELARDVSADDETRRRIQRRLHEAREHAAEGFRLREAMRQQMLTLEEGMDDA